MFELSCKYETSPFFSNRLSFIDNSRLDAKNCSHGTANFQTGDNF